MVAHTVGPVYKARDPEHSKAQLQSCYESSLKLCKENGGGVIGFSSISTGICKPFVHMTPPADILMRIIDGYPITDATDVACETTRRFLEQDDSVCSAIHGDQANSRVGYGADHSSQVKKVIFVVFSARDEDVYKSVAPAYFPAAEA